MPLCLLSFICHLRKGEPRTGPRCRAGSIFGRCLSRGILYIFMYARGDYLRQDTMGIIELLPVRMRLPNWGWHYTPWGRRNCNQVPRSCKLHSCHKDSPEPCIRRCLNIDNKQILLIQIRYKSVRELS